MYPVRTPSLVRRLFPSLSWVGPDSGDTIYLTFDDGPTPRVTEQVLDHLAEYEASATFFCIGKNVEKHPSLFTRILDEGHSVGNHTYGHLSGWRTSTEDYAADISRCAEVFSSRLFRPPYGRIKPRQIKLLQNEYQIVMWDVLSGDFDERITAEQCLKHVCDHARPGSIIVMHDSLKAAPRLLPILPRILKRYSERGYRFQALTA